MIEPTDPTERATPPATTSSSGPDSAFDPTDHAGPSRELVLTPDPPAAPGSAVLPEPPREGFELGAIDVSAERPSHGLSPDRSTRWLVMGLVGGSLALAGLITLIRGGDDPSEGDGIELRASLGDPLRSSMLALEAVRLEAIHVTAVRAMSDTPAVIKASARKPARADGATPAATTPAASTPASGARDGSGGAAAGRGSAPAIGDLPPPPPEEAEAPRSDAPKGEEPKGDASPPPEPAEPRPSVDAPDGDSRAESGSAPSGV